MSPRRSLFFVLHFLCLPLPATASGLAPVQLHASMDNVLIHESLEYFVETDIKIDPETLFVMNGTHFQRPDSGRYNFPLNDRDYWFRFTTQNADSQAVSWLLEFDVEFIDRIQVFAVGSDGERRRYSFDVLRGHNPDFSDYRHPLLRIDSDAGELTTFYIHMERDRVAPIAPTSLRLWSANMFQKHVALEYIAFGLFYGGMLVAMLYNLMLFITIRSIAHLYYVIYISVACTSWFTQNGLAYQYLWQNSPLLIEYSASFLALGAALTGSIYTRNFLETARRAPILDRYILIVIAGSTASIVMMPFIAISTFNQLGYLMVAMGVTAYPFVGAYVWYRGYKPARLFTVGWLFFGFGTLAYVMAHMGILPNVAPYTVAGQVGNWVEAILLSIALADRLNLVQQERNKAKQRYQRMLVHSKDELERQVQERTAELANAKEAAEQLARTDTLTGLPNRRCFFERSEAELLRSRRFEHPLSLFILDIDHFKSINDRYGHAFGDQALQAVASVIRDCLRDTDILGRIGGEEFAAVLPQSDTDSALQIAERLRLCIEELEFLTNGDRLTLSASIGLATLHDGESLDQLMARADELLYQAKNSGRNRVIAAV